MRPVRVTVDVDVMMRKAACGAILETTLRIKHLGETGGGRWPARVKRRPMLTCAPTRPR